MGTSGRDTSAQRSILECYEGEHETENEIDRLFHQQKGVKLNTLAFHLILSMLKILPAYPGGACWSNSRRQVLVTEPSQNHNWVFISWACILPISCITKL